MKAIKLLDFLFGVGGLLALGPLASAHGGEIFSLDEATHTKFRLIRKSALITF